MSKETCLATISNTLPDVLPDIKITDLSELGLKQLLHISDNPNIPHFTPTVPYRASKDQDHRLPRICTATGLAGCIIGYNGVSNDFMDRTWEDPKWLGGYVIYTFKPEVVVTPSVKILGDQHITDEQWIVSYDTDTVNYVPTIAGRIFLSEFKMDAEPNPDATKDSPTKQRLNYHYRLYVEINAGEEVLWNRSHALSEGHYRIDAKNLMTAENCDSFTDFVITKIDSVDYLMAKQVTAGLLSAEYPQSLKW